MIARLPSTSTRASNDALTLVRVAVRDACVFYPKQVHCLQRSAVVTSMLRRRGLRARLIIGYQTKPILGHAWVELDDKVVWDHDPRLPHYRILDRI